MSQLTKGVIPTGDRFRSFRYISHSPTAANHHEAADYFQTWNVYSQALEIKLRFVNEDAE